MVEIVSVFLFFFNLQVTLVWLQQNRNKNERFNVEVYKSLDYSQLFSHSGCQL